MTDGHLEDTSLESVGSETVALLWGCIKQRNAQLRIRASFDIVLLLHPSSDLSSNTFALAISHNMSHMSHICYFRYAAFFKHVKVHQKGVNLWQQRPCDNPGWEYSSFVCVN